MEWPTSCTRWFGSPTPERSRAFYEALGFTFSRDMDIVRDGQLEATNYFFSLGDQTNVLELTYNRVCLPGHSREWS